MSDPSRASRLLSWAPKYSFEELVHDMIESDLKLITQTKMLDRISFSKINKCRVWIHHCSLYSNLVILVIRDTSLQS